VFGIGAAIPGGGDGHRERRAFLAVLERLSRQHPVVALVDDAHWSDLPSLQWLAQLLRRTEGLQLAVIVAARPAQPGEVGELLKRMRTQPGVDRLEPRPLSPEGVRSLVSREAPEASEALIEACIVATGGNPFLVQELLRSLGREGDGALAMASAEDVLLQQRAGLDRVVLARLAPLGPSARSLAAAAAVFPTETQLRLAAELAELDIRTAGEAADAMTAAGVLAEGRPLRFVHPLTRQAIYDDLSATQRSELHRKAFALLSGEGGAIQDIAAHALLIEPSGDPAVAEHLATAAAHARSLGAAEIAVRYLERALAEPVEVQKRPEVQLELGELYFDLARYESGIESLTQALDSSHNAQRCRTVETLSECLGYGLHKWEESDRVILAELERMGDSWTDDRMSLLCWTWTAPPAETLDDAIAHISGSGRGGAEVLEARANLHFERCDASAEHIRKLMERAFELAPNPDVINLPVLIQSESLDLAVPRLQKRLQRAQAEGSTSRMALQYRLLGDAERMEGNLRSADTCYRQALALTEGRNAITKARLALTLLERGLVDEARAFLEGYSLGGEPDDAREAYASSLSVCLLWFVRGQLAMVDGDLDRAERELRRSDDDDDWGCSSRLCDVLLRQGRRDEARAYTEKMVDLHSVLQAPSQLGLALALHARCLADTEAALAELEPALKHLKTGANRVSHAEGLLIQGETLRRARRLTEARPVLAHARELALDCDAGLLAGRIAAEQRLAGAKPRRTAVTGVDSLTASERRVVELAAAGKTNLEIAGELVLSVRTIEMHLGRVYRKLDITGRTALAAAMSAK
jgi:DNA-binding CsgD family transcriptional regulator